MRTTACVIILFFIFSGNTVLGQDTKDINSKLEQIQLSIEAINIKINNMQHELQQLQKDVAAIKQQKSGSSNSSPVADQSVIKTTVNSLGGVLREKPSSTGGEIARIAPNTPVSVHRYQRNLYFKVEYKGKTGYLNYSSISSHPEIDKFLVEENKRKEQQKNAQEQKLAKENPRLARLTKLYGKEKATKIINKQLFTGMSHGMVMEALGRPIDQKKTTSGAGLREEWTYDNKILIFLNGELKEWKDK